MRLGAAAPPPLPPEPPPAAHHMPCHAPCPPSVPLVLQHHGVQPQPDRGRLPQLQHRAVRADRRKGSPDRGCVALSGVVCCRNAGRAWWWCVHAGCGAACCRWCAAGGSKPFTCRIGSGFQRLCAFACACACVTSPPPVSSSGAVQAAPSAGRATDRAPPLSPALLAMEGAAVVRCLGLCEPQPRAHDARLLAPWGPPREGSSAVLGRQ